MSRNHVRRLFLGATAGGCLFEAGCSASLHDQFATFAGDLLRGFLAAMLL